MNWEKMSIERLRDYETRKQSLQLIEEQIKVLELEFPAIRSARTDGTPTSNGSGNKREDALINNIAKREELQRNYDIAQKEVAITEKGLEGLTKDEKTVLTRFFISRSFGHVEKLCEELHIEKTKAYTLKDEALKKFTMACYGVVEI